MIPPVGYTRNVLPHLDQLWRGMTVKKKPNFVGSGPPRVLSGSLVKLQAVSFLFKITLS